VNLSHIQLAVSLYRLKFVWRECTT